MLAFTIFKERLMLLPITLTLAAAAALFNIWLAVRVSRYRMSQKIMHGDGGCTPLAKRMRAQANYVEYTPFILILFALVELALGSSTWLWILALVYILARVAHAFGMDSDKGNAGRAGGILLTFLIMIALSGAALYAAYHAMARIDAPPVMAANI
jgi:uncharacterized membrane protein YecN with MAPEG domain